MWKQLLTFAFLIACVCAVDRTIYRNCRESELCSKLRGLKRQNRLKISPYSTSRGPAHTVSFLERADDEKYFLNISAPAQNIFRVQIEELKRTRFLVQDAVSLFPEMVHFDEAEIGPNTTSVRVGNGKFVITNDPFSLQIFYGDKLQLVLESDRMTLEKNDINNPFTFGVKFPQASKMYGLHEHADHLALRTTEPGGADPYRLKNTDLPEYELHSTMAMYGAIPVLYGHGVNGTSGIFLNNAAELWVEITNHRNGGEAYFMADSGALELYVFLGPTIDEVVRQYALLTGVAHLPPLWTLGYHQCRWGYADQEDVQTVIAEFDNNDFPVDAIWLDIQHTNNMKFFTWNPGNFSTPFDMLQNLSSTHRYLVTLSDPHFKVEEGYFVYDEGIKRDFFIKNPNGTVFEDQCWPGRSVWMDYLNPEASDYYSSLYLYENWNGTTSTLGGIWNDMNEAAIFNDANEKTFPYDVKHNGNISNRELHNLYGFLQTKATHKGLIDRDNGTLRPFILTRAHFAGSQRYAAIWTGDNTADWGYIPIAYAMCLNANLLGISFCGADIGGFFGNPNEELLERFYQAGAWLPFFREHSYLDTERREPYLYSPSVQSVIREAIKTRYAHLPVWYTRFYEHTRNGDPVIRPLFYHYPDDSNVFDIDDQLLVGSDILVKVVSEPKAKTVQMYFPGGEDLLWYPADFSSGFYQGTGYHKVPVTILQIPVYYRAGSIIPTKQTSRPSTTDMKDDGYTLIVALDGNFTAFGTVYIDDNLSFEYQNSQRYNYLNLTSSLFDVTVSSIDDSNTEGFELVITTVINLTPIIAKDGSLTGEYVKKTYNQTVDGVPLSSIKVGGAKSVTLKLS